jgi:hypothetical protein
MAKMTLLVLALTVLALPAAAQPDRAEVLTKVRALIADRDVYAAIEYMQSLGEPPVVAKAYGQLVMDLYWKAKDVPAVVALGRAGILYCLTMANRLEAKSPEGAAPWFGQAKMIAYNVGSFTWPGWAEKGITLRPADVRAGREAAALNLRLAIKLKVPPQKLSAAHWLVGAHHLAAGKHQDAVRSFTTAGERSTEAKDAAGAQMNAGYVGVALILSGAEPSGRKALDAAVKKLTEIGSDDAQFYAKQLTDVLKALQGPKKRGR